MQLLDRPILRWFYVAIIVTCFCLEWHLWHNFSELDKEVRLTVGSLDHLRAALASEVEARKGRLYEIAQRRSALSQLLNETAPNGIRILRMLQILAADRRNLGPSDPVKASRAYGTAANGYHDELLKNESYTKAIRTIQRYDLEASLTPLLRWLTEQNVESSRLVDLTLEWRTSWVEATSIALQQGLDSKLAWQAANTAGADVQKEIEQYIGEDNFATYKDYLHGQYIADLVQERLSYTGSAMTSEQYMNLAALAGTGGERNVNEGTLTDEAFLAAQAFLTPDQIQVLQDFREKR